MGIAAYNRGSGAVRKQIKSAPMSAQCAAEMERARLEPQIAGLKTELEKARRALAASRALSAVRRDEIGELRGQIQNLKTERAEWAKAFLTMKRKWEFVSRIVRAFVSPEAVKRFRGDESKAVTA